MENIAFSSDSVNNEQKPDCTDEVQQGKLLKPGNPSRSASMSSTAENRDAANKRQEERSLWIEKVEHRLQIAKERLQSKTIGFQILKVPVHRRQPPEMFTPVGWRFGLHNLDSVDRDSSSEALKLCVPLLYGLDDVEKWEKFCEEVVPDLTKMLGCYGLYKEDINLNEEEIKQVLAFDALFIAWRIDARIGNRIFTKEDYTLPLEKKRLFTSFVKLWATPFRHDVWKVENQIPFELIKRAMEYIKSLKTPAYQFEQNGSLLEMWMKEAVWLARHSFNTGDNMDGEEISDLRLSESDHILDATYRAICGKQGLERRPDWAENSFIHIPSAIQLKHAGVKIEGVAGPLCTMSYIKKTKSLILPKMHMYDTTFAFIRNMAQYEVVEWESSMFYDYISLIQDLIKTPEDVDYMVKCGVIDNFCGSRAYEKWKALNEGLALVSSSKEHNAMKENIKRRYNQKLPKLWREFRTLFCSRPWLMVPVIAATLVTIATLLQTYTAIIGSDRMMPHYKNP